MQSRWSGAGVCIIRIEAQPDHLLITVTTNRNIGRSIYSARSEHVLRFADIDTALASVADFLHSFGPQTRRA
jgi:hypothetical protein